MNHVTVYVDQTIGKQVVSTRFRNLDDARKFATAMKGTVRPPKEASAFGQKLLAAISSKEVN